MTGWADFSRAMCIARSLGHEPEQDSAGKPGYGMGAHRHADTDYDRGDEA